MTRWSRTELVFAWTAGALSCCSTLTMLASAQETPHNGPAQMRVELENPTIMALRVVLRPHEQTGMHDLSARLVIWLTAAHLKDTMADGSVREYQRAAGTVEWVPPQRHAGENLSDQPIEFIAVVPKVSAASALEGHPQH